MDGWWLMIYDMIHDSNDVCLLSWPRLTRNQSDVACPNPCHTLRGPCRTLFFFVLHSKVVAETDTRAKRRKSMILRVKTGQFLTFFWIFTFCTFLAIAETHQKLMKVEENMSEMMDLLLERGECIPAADARVEGRKICLRWDRRWHFRVKCGSSIQNIISRWIQVEDE